MKEDKIFKKLVILRAIPWGTLKFRIYLSLQAIQNNEADSPGEVSSPTGTHQHIDSILDLQLPFLYNNMRSKDKEL